MVALCRVALDLLLGELLVDVSVTLQQNFRNKFPRPTAPGPLSQNANERVLRLGREVSEDDACRPGVA